MSKIVKVFFVVAFIASLIGCASGTSVSKNAPEWVTSADSVYNSAEYLNAVGSGQDRRSAENDALSLLVRGIIQNVSAVSDATKVISGSNEGGYETLYGYAASIETVAVVEDIPGVNYREVWTASNGTVYVLAQINREEVGRYYRKQIDEQTSVIESEIIYANKNPGTFEALAALGNAMDVAKENQKDIAMLAGIHPDMFRLVSPDYIGFEAVAVLYAREQEKIKVAVRVVGDSGERIAGAFESVLSATGIRLVSQEEESRYLLNASVTMTEIEGNEKYEYVRYVLDAELLDSVTQKVLVPYTENGREAHISQSEAQQRAYRTVEESVKKNYKPLLQEYLDSLR